MAAIFGSFCWQGLASTFTTCGALARFPALLLRPGESASGFFGLLSAPSISWLLSHTLSGTALAPCLAERDWWTGTILLSLMARIFRLRQEATGSAIGTV